MRITTPPALSLSRLYTYLLLVPLFLGEFALTVQLNWRTTFSRLSYLQTRHPTCCRCYCFRLKRGYVQYLIKLDFFSVFDFPHPSNDSISLLRNALPSTTLLLLLFPRATFNLLLHAYNSIQFY